MNHRSHVTDARRAARCDRLRENIRRRNRGDRKARRENFLSALCVLCGSFRFVVVFVRVFREVLQRRPRVAVLHRRDVEVRRLDVRD